MTRESTGAERLQKVLMAAARAPGNRSRFLRAGLIDASGELVTAWQSAFHRLQPLSKAELRSQPGQFLAQATDVVFRGKTSGTQAEAFTYFAGERWNQKRIEARQHRLKQWNLESLPVLNLASRLSPVRLQDSSLVGPVDPAFLEILLQSLRTKPRILRGYPSRLCEVAIALHHSQHRLQPGSVAAVIATGECLFECQRSLLHRTFAAPVINEYGCQESGMSGLSCPEVGRLHLDGDRCLYEVIKEELLTTDLYNHTLPMVRYRSGDVLQLCSGPCPCGRPGPTAQVLGRQEETIRLKGQDRWSAELDLPAFAGVLAYQIQIATKRRRLWVQPSLTMTQADLMPLKDWLVAIAGTAATEILIESPFATAAASYTSLDAVDSATWLQQVSGQAWSGWLNNPLPLGSAQETAALLKQLVAPRQIILQRLPSQSQKQIQALNQSQPERSGAVEAMKIRVLLWATGLMTATASDLLQAKSLYLSLLERLRCWAESQSQTERKSAAALGFDLLAPLLTLDTPTAQSLWQTVQDLIQSYWPQGITADVFTLHHYLAVLDQAGQNAQRRPHAWVPALRPLSALLLGDLHRFAPELDLAMMALWAEIVHGCPAAFTTAEAIAPSPSFRSLWQAQRQALLRQDKTAVTQHLSSLFDLAQSPGQVAQVWLEKGYAALVLGDRLEPTVWLDVLRQQIGSWNQTAGAGSPQGVANPMPWVPILRTLAPELAAAGQPAIAYACLVAAAPPNRHLSNFDRQTRGVNGKQSVISHWSAEP
ncbi:MAG: hypothetical protein HC816_20035 [Leptolyngbyaceae cyanobacterium RM1_1_2]|nr:hypothetical protein [Leptolyngbyaceae cyanobacterium RM1_1_2]